MIDAFRDGGFMMWPILVCGALVLTVAASSGRKLLRAQTNQVIEARSGIDAVLFWGGFAVVLGVLGTVVGVMQIAQAIERAGETTATLLWAGIKVSLITTVFGLLVLTVALLVWIALWSRYRKVITTRAA